MSWFKTHVDFWDVRWVSSDAWAGFTTGAAGLDELGPYGYGSELLIL